MHLKNKLITAVSYIAKPWKRNLISISRNFENKYGLEIGGPSPETFSLHNILPVYVYAKKIDGVNFSNHTIWEGSILEGNTYAYFQHKKGHQYIADATILTELMSNRYDFVLSSHSLEHIANPVKALMEWHRILKRGGQLVLVLPDKDNTFDSNRAITSFEHLISDFKNETAETDNTHLEEMLSNHNFNYDHLNTYDTLKAKLANNFETRVAHHHVFSLEVISQLLDFAGFSTVYQQVCPPFHLVTIASKR